MRDWFRRYVWHNFLLKIVSLVLAVLLWSAVTREPVAEVWFNVPIEFQHRPENLEITSVTTPQAQVRIRGPVEAVRKLSPADIHAVIDLAGAKAGERTYELRPDRIALPYNVHVVDPIVPSQFRLTFDRRGRRLVEVRPRVTGMLASGFEIRSIVAEPSSVWVIGPEARVARLEAVLTDPVDAAGVVGRALFVTNAYVPDPLLRIAGSTQVHVTVTTEKSAPAVPPKG